MPGQGLWLWLGFYASLAEDVARILPLPRRAGWEDYD